LTLAGDGDREVYFEFVAVGSAVKVTAIDSATAIEVSVMGPASAARADLERLALQKLKARLDRDGAR
jgi:tRNA nucleotidyltransferase (CCA-adding enzyme)